MNGVEVSAKMTSNYDEKTYTVEYDPDDQDVITLTRDGYLPWCLDKEDVDTLVSLLVAYRDGFTFPPKPDPTSDSHSAFTDQGE